MADKDYKMFIVEGEAREPQRIKYEQYSGAITPGTIYDMELKEADMKRIFVLSAFPEFLLDYFGVKLWKTSVRNTNNRRIKTECKKEL